MKVDLSEQSLDALAEIISGGSANDYAPPIGLYRQGWKIQQFMAQFGINTEVGGSRVAMTRAALAAACGRPDRDHLLENILIKASDPRDFIDAPEKLSVVIAYLNRYLEFDDLRIEQAGQRTRLVRIIQTNAAVSGLAASVEQINFDTVSRDLERALASAEADPEDAITAACSIVESVCRSVLIELGLELPAKKDIQGLYQAVREPLGLSPSKTGVPDLVAGDVRTVLGGLNSVVNGIGSLRTHAGDAHGRERGFKRVDARIARFAIHSASAAALFIVETWQQKFPLRALHARQDEATTGDRDGG